jgi:hypothetical protein
MEAVTRSESGTTRTSCAVLYGLLYISRLLLKPSRSELTSRPEFSYERLGGAKGHCARRRLGRFTETDQF